MRVALTGSDGMLGHDISKVFNDVDLIGFTLRDFDIIDRDRTLSVIKQAHPDYLIHAAAYTDVEGSEDDPERAYLVNGIGTRNVTMACEEIGCPILYMSTDYVFDGTKNEPYDEWDKTNPINRYGVSKLLGEQFVSSLTNRFYIVRTSWLYGKKGKNFVDTICRLLMEKKELDVVDDQTGSPTYTFDLARKLRDLIGKGYGTYHVTNSSHCSWYEFASEIAAIKGSGTRLNPVTSAKFGLRAQRPAFSVLNSTMMKLEGLDEPRAWREALRDYLDT